MDSLERYKENLIEKAVKDFVNTIMEIQNKKEEDLPDVNTISLAELFEISDRRRYENMYKEANK